MNKSNEEMLREEQELERRILGTPPEEPTSEPEAATEEPSMEATPPEGEALVAPTPEPVVPEKAPETRETEETWEKRYKGLRASRDDKSYRLTQELSVAHSEIASLQAHISQLQAQRPTVTEKPDMFTQEQREALGDSTVDALQTAVERSTAAATKPLQEQLARERKQREQLAQSQAESSKKEVYNMFLSRISKAVPDWEEVNYDPEFKKWCDGPDIDGTPRKTYFAEAESRGNSALIIRYMQEFKASKEQKKVDKLADKVTPTGESAGATQAVTDETVLVYTKAQIDKFYDDLSRGKYNGRASEAKAIEDEIDKAAMEGRIR